MARPEDSNSGYMLHSLHRPHHSLHTATPRIPFGGYARFDVVDPKQETTTRNDVDRNGFTNRFGLASDEIGVKRDLLVFPSFTKS